MTTPTTREELITQIAAVLPTENGYRQFTEEYWATAILDRVPILDAAPDMLAALEAWVSLFVDMSDRTVKAARGHEEGGWVLDARAAIKKARGE